MLSALSILSALSLLSVLGGTLLAAEHAKESNESAPQKEPAETPRPAQQVPPEPLLAELSPPLRELVRAMDERLAQVERFEAQFTRDRFTPLLRRPLRSSGRVWMLGTRVRWETLQPRPGVTLLTDREVWIFDPQEKRAEVYPIRPEYLPMGSSPMPRLAEMLPSFTLHFAGEELLDDLLIGLPESRQALREGGRKALWLEPREDELREFLLGLGLIFDTESQMLHQLVIVQPGAERTVYSFEAIRINGSFSDRLLELDLPRGTVIERPYGGGASGEGTAPAEGAEW